MTCNVSPPTSNACHGLNGSDHSRLTPRVSWSRPTSPTTVATPSNAGISIGGSIEGVTDHSHPARPMLAADPRPKVAPRLTVPERSADTFLCSALRGMRILLSMPPEHAAGTTKQPRPAVDRVCRWPSGPTGGKPKKAIRRGASAAASSASTTALTAGRYLGVSTHCRCSVGA